MSDKVKAGEAELFVEILATVRPPKMLAVMRGVRFGLADNGEVGLSFGAYVAEDLGAPMFLDAERAALAISDYRVADVSRLEGKPCWVALEGGRMRFVSPCLI